MNYKRLSDERALDYPDFGKWSAAKLTPNYVQHMARKGWQTAFDRMCEMKVDGMTLDEEILGRLRFIQAGFGMMPELEIDVHLDYYRHKFGY